MSDIAIIGIIAAALIVFRVALTAPEKTPQQRREEQELNREFGVSAPAQIDRLADAIAEAGHSPALLRKLQEKEQAELELLAQIDAQKRELELLTNLPSDHQIQNLAEKLRPILNSQEPNTLRRWLRELIHHIEVARVDKKLIGVIYYYMPDELKNSSIERSHRGGQIYRRIFEWSLYGEFGCSTNASNPCADFIQPV